MLSFLRLKMANLRWLLLHVITRTKGWKTLIFDRSSAKPIRIARLPNRTPDNSSRSIQSKIHSKSKRNRRVIIQEMQLWKRPASAAGIPCAKEQPSRCLPHWACSTGHCLASSNQCGTQIAQIRHFEPQKRQYTTTEVGLCLFWVLT